MVQNMETRLPSPRFTHSFTKTTALKAHAGTKCPPPAQASPNYHSSFTRLAPRPLSRLICCNAVLGNVACLAAVVTSLGGLGVQGGCTGALLRDVAALSARVTLDAVGLAVFGKVVGATALVTDGRLSCRWSLSSWGCAGGAVFVLWAFSADVPELRTIVALGSLSTVWAVSLNVADFATRVALLAHGGLWLGASSGLVTCLATVVAQSLSLLAVLGNVADFSAFVTGSLEHGGGGKKFLAELVKTAGVACPA